MPSHRKLESALEQSEKLFRVLFDAIEDSVIVYEIHTDGSRGLIKDVNKAACRSLGYTREELLQMTVLDIDAPESKACNISPKTRYSDGSALFEAVNIAKDGTSIPVEINARKLEYNGKQMVLAISRDISARKHTEKLQKEYLKTLEQQVALRTAEIQNINQSLLVQVKERKAAERKAVKAEKDIKSLIDASNQSIFMIDLEGKVLYANTNLAKNIKTTTAELIGKNVYNFIPEDLARSRKKFLNQAAETGAPVHFNDIRDDKNLFHSIYPIFENGKVVKFAHYSEDLSKVLAEQKKAKLAIKDNEEQFRALFEENHSVMFILEPSSGKIIKTNKAAEKFYGYTQEELESKYIHQLNSLPVNEVKDLMKRAQKHKLNSFIFKHVVSGDKIRDVEVFSGPFVFKGETRLISIVHDITERIENEKKLSLAKEEAVMANKAKDEFIANISHEIRTPLNGIMGMLQLIQNSDSKYEKIDYIDIALQSSKNLLRVLDDVLDFSKVQSGNLDIIKEPFSIKRLMDECINLFEFQAKEQNIELSYNISNEAEGCYMGDEGRIRQILFNLIGNALKFTEHGKVVITVTTSESSTTGFKSLNFSVSDTGIGIPEDKIESIFDSFTQVDGSLSRKYKGAGLGLSIVKKLIGLMNGFINVESRIEHGTTIKFSLKLEIDKTNHKTSENRDKYFTDVPALKILLVEDELVNRMMASKILEKMGHQIFCAENGQECLNMLEKETIDLILMDIQMPVLDGIQATKTIRTSHRYKNYHSTPIIALSAHATALDKRNAKDAGVDEYISKPFEWDVLARTLGKFACGA
ncbi:PAS domain-containing hybrid sensor histidine kinase/response regulator [Maridesulfovibrio zosterae]|uniref:PAS domain-containing hybrid sensor histidine kinase/response regulator n=1 Tax=Maridesulfovibrio zosterae TaxID=82171 RepID=UPI000401E0BB|nr:PAS domain S-box protein [Maridesulfovibrio zosterae]